MADFFFGYGSLVNTATHSYSAAEPAVLRGWRRCWHGTAVRDVAFLSVIPDPDCQIEGLVARVDRAEWAALDQREAAYDRQDVRDQVAPAPKEAVSLIAFAVPERLWQRAPAAQPIYLSYIDVVVQGYLRIFGSEGAARFFATTDGWDRPILDDRAAPLYPRHQVLSPKERQFVDDQLAQLGAAPAQASFGST